MESNVKLAGIVTGVVSGAGAEPVALYVMPIGNSAAFRWPEEVARS